jgi:L-serine dehydratase
LPDSGSALAAAGIDLQIVYGDFGDPHPNTYRLTLRRGATKHHLIAISTGGGMMEVIEIDGVSVSISGDYDETLVWYPEPLPRQAVSWDQALNADHVHMHTSDGLTLIQIQAQSAITDDQVQQHLPAATAVARLAPVLPVRSRKDLGVPFQSCAEMIQSDGDRNTPLWKLAVEYESMRGDLSEAQVIEKMSAIVGILRASIAEGLAGTEYDDRVLGFQSGGFQEQMQRGSLLDGGVLNRTVLYTTALMEVKSSMGVIVAAPTAGACAALPATCLAVGEELRLDETQIAQGMLAAGLVGVFIATGWTFAAEVGGCQAEGGAASAMAAAALVTFAGGTRDQAVGAASMAMQNTLGLICDPVASRVEVPCLGKNVMAASNALSCANMALAGFDPVIPLDETIAAAKSVAERMPREHRCTALGGLAATATAKAIEQRLIEGCGPACGCSAKTVTLQSKS